MSYSMFRTMRTAEYGTSSDTMLEQNPGSRVLISRRSASWTLSPANIALHLHKDIEKIHICEDEDDLASFTLEETSLIISALACMSRLQELQVSNSNHLVQELYCLFTPRSPSKLVYLTINLCSVNKNSNNNKIRRPQSENILESSRKISKLQKMNLNKSLMFRNRELKLGLARLGKLLASFAHCLQTVSMIDHDNSAIFLAKECNTNMLELRNMDKKSLPLLFLHNENFRGVEHLSLFTKQGMKSKSIMRMIASAVIRQQKVSYLDCNFGATSSRKHKNKKFLPDKHGMYIEGLFELFDIEFSLEFD